MRGSVTSPGSIPGASLRYRVQMTQGERKAFVAIASPREGHCCLLISSLQCLPLSLTGPCSKSVIDSQNRKEVRRGSSDRERREYTVYGAC